MIIKLVIKALLEVIQSGGKNTELAVMRGDQSLKILNLEEVEKYDAEIEKEETKESIMTNKIVLVAIFKFKLWMILKMACRHFHSISPYCPSPMINFHFLTLKKLEGLPWWCSG